MDVHLDNIKTTLNKNVSQKLVKHGSISKDIIVTIVNFAEKIIKSIIKQN